MWDAKCPFLTVPKVLVIPAVVIGPEFGSPESLVSSTMPASSLFLALIEVDGVPLLRLSGSLWAAISLASVAAGTQRQRI